MQKKLTQKELKEIVNYDKKTGVFTWKIDRGGTAKKGDIAGCLGGYGYWILTIKGKTYQAHRIAFLYMRGYFPENEVDHKDRNRANNAWSNLREVSRTCNARNCGIQARNKNGVIGVCKVAGETRYRAKITVNKKPIHLGRFDDIASAAKARWEAEKKYGFPGCNTTSSAFVYLKRYGHI